MGQLMTPLRSILVTGASTGIGAACSRDLVGRGWRAYAGVRSVEAGEALRAQAAGIVPLLLDVTDAGSIAAAAERLVGELEDAGLSGLVNNAGIAVNGPLEFVPLEDFRRQLEVNVTGLVAVTQAMLPLLRKARGRIVNISSVSGLVAYPFLAPYAASKHAVEALSDALRIELASWGIRVALIEPGPVATRIWAKARSTAETQARNFPPAARELYPGYLTAVSGMIDEAERGAVPVDVVVAAVRDALTSSRPKARYPLGPGSLLARLRRFLPDRLWDALVLHSLKRLSRP